jgi:hypothetical protein
MCLSGKEAGIPQHTRQQRVQLEDPRYNYTMERTHAFRRERKEFDLLSTVA